MSIIAEAVTWGHHHLYATGLGAYIAQTNSLNHPRMVLGIVMMALYVVVINRVLWRPLYRIAETRFQLD